MIRLAGCFKLVGTCSQDQFTCWNLCFVDWDKLLLRVLAVVGCCHRNLFLSEDDVGLPNLRVFHRHWDLQLLFLAILLVVNRCQGSNRSLLKIVIVASHFNLLSRKSLIDLGQRL